MIIAKKVNGITKETGQEPIKGSKSLYNYLLETKKVTDVSIINYQGKNNPNTISSTRFEVMIEHMGGKISPRIIAYNSPTGLTYYTVEFLADNNGAIFLDRALRNIKATKIAKNGSDLYTMSQTQLMSVLRRL